MMRRLDKRKCIRNAVFVILVIAIFIALNSFLLPAWTSWNNFSTIRGFYEEPRDTFETIFLGPSYTVNGFTPMELYEEYGICSYNLGTEQQPLLASYYWLQEAYRYHSNSLKSVVLECNCLCYRPSFFFCQKAIDPMRFSSIKYQAVRDYLKYYGEEVDGVGDEEQGGVVENEGITDDDSVDNDGKEKNALYYCFPMYAFHSRWQQLGKEDFEKNGYVAERFARGYNFTLSRYFDTAGYDTMQMMAGEIDSEVEPSVPDEEGMIYLNQIIKFCSEKGLKLILTSTPRRGDPARYNLLSRIAKENELEYLDFSCGPLVDEIEINLPLDFTDGGHLNYYGASKLTHWFGQHLKEKYDATDVRGNSRFSFLEKQLDEYNLKIKNVVAMKEERDISQYISLARQNKDYAIFIAIRDDGTKSLSEETKGRLRDMGLARISDLKIRDSYVAVFEKGVVTLEATNGAEITEREGCLSDGTTYSISSAGFDAGDVASCIINGTECAGNARGFNIVVYDCKKQSVVDSAVFDTWLSDKREAGYLMTLLEEEAGKKPFSEMSASLQKLFLYERRCKQEKRIQLLCAKMSEDPGENLLSFLEMFSEDENIIVYLTADEASMDVLGRQEKTKLKEIGLPVLSELKRGDVYVGIQNNGKACLEESGSAPVRAEYYGARICCGSEGSGISSYVMTDNSRKDVGTPGINIVAYDTELRMVIYTANFAKEDANAQADK